MPVKILIIDCHQAIQKRVASALEMEGYQVITAANGMEGLRKVDEESPDLVMLEVLLPGLDGYEVCHRLRAKGIRVPIVLLSARLGEKERATALKVGADAYVAKSGELSELVASVDKLLAQKKAPQKAPEEKGAQIFAFLGIRGGVGTTTVAVNVAVVLAQEKRRVVLVDFCPSFDLNTSLLPLLLGLRPESDRGRPPRGKHSKLNSFGHALVAHDTGVKVLTCSSLRHRCYDDLTPKDVDTLIEELGPQHDYLIIDMPPYLSSALKGALARCHRVILVTASAPHALGRIKSVAALLNGLGVAREQLATVINDKGCILGDVPSATIEPVLTSIIEVPLLGVIPYSAFGHEWEAQGVPAVLAEPGSPTSLALIELAHRLMGSQTPSETEEHGAETAGNEKEPRGEPV